MDIYICQVFYRKVLGICLFLVVKLYIRFIHHVGHCSLLYQELSCSSQFRCFPWSFQSHYFYHMPPTYHLKNHNKIYHNLICMIMLVLKASPSFHGVGVPNFFSGNSTNVRGFSDELVNIL